MATLILLLWIVAAVLVMIRGFGIVSLGRVHLGWLGLGLALCAVVLSKL